ncbi:MAG: hypothetical protein DWP98_04910 [Bacteroidetes bacterium]|nr:MAG: hypothetical protein DWP98_04910 [Bacteroidota bacterium]MBL1143757.1 hypothetical protein [Bacteroidota bacterium]
MFMDGTYYATIARNMAEGIGSFWKPHLTSTVGPIFLDHPPLAFGLQSIGFWVFGDSLFVERFYSLSTFVVTAYFISLIWKNCVKKEFRAYFWIPLLLWLTVPKMIWSVSNNMLENTLMVFIITSIWAQIKFIKTEKIFWLIFSGFLLFLGFLTKGLVALFPLSFLFFYRVFKKDLKLIKMVFQYLVLIGGLLFPFLILYVIMPEGIESITNYFEIQVVNSLKNEQTVSSRFYILRKAFEESLVMIILSVILLVLNKRYFKIQGVFQQERTLWIWVFTATAFSGVLPILVSLKQSVFYINPVFPLFAIVVALVIAPIIIPFIQKVEIKKKAIRGFKFLGIGFFAIGLVAIFSQVGKTNREQDKLSDIKTILSIVPENSTIYIGQDIYREWSLHGYFNRYGKVNLNWKNPEDYAFMIRGKGNLDSPPNGFIVSSVELKTLELLTK